ncbi:MAG: hypothetical protein ABI569_12535, partial [Casimicrobiaceae bacterium]
MRFTGRRRERPGQAARCERAALQGESMGRSSPAGSGNAIKPHVAWRHLLLAAVLGCSAARAEAQLASGNLADLSLEQLSDIVVTSVSR